MERKQENFQDLFNKIDFEKIIDHPNILIAASFWDEDRYNGARTFYRFMRYIDDLIDNYKTANLKFSEGDKKQYIGDVNQWLEILKSSNTGNALQQEIMETIARFHIPIWPLEAFAKSMIYDIHHDGFATLQQFIDYAGGASVAPASIFVHLSGLREENGLYLPPLFDVREVTIPCAMFSYLVHIIRDFQKDQFNNLNYLADDILEKYGLNRKNMKQIADTGDFPDAFRSIIKEYYALADQYKTKTYGMIQTIRPYLGPRYQLSMEIIFNLYLMIFEKIDPESGQFTTGALNATVDETRSRVLETIKKFQENHKPV